MTVNIDYFKADDARRLHAALGSGHRFLKEVCITGKARPYVRSTESRAGRTGHARADFGVFDALANYSFLRSLRLFFELDDECEMDLVLPRLAQIVASNPLDVLHFEAHVCYDYHFFLPTGFFVSVISCETLRALIVRNFRLDDESGAALAGAAGTLPRLQMLDISGNPHFGERTADSVVQLIRKSGNGNRIETISVAGCGFGTRGMVLLLEALNAAVYAKPTSPTVALVGLDVGLLHLTAQSCDSVRGVIESILYRYIGFNLRVSFMLHLFSDETPSRVRAIKDANDDVHAMLRFAPSLADGQEEGGAGAFATLSNEMICAVLERVYPVRSYVEAAWTCRLLRACANNYVAGLRTGVFDWRVPYRDALFEKNYLGVKH